MKTRNLILALLAACGLAMTVGCIMPMGPGGERGGRDRYEDRDPGHRGDHGDGQPEGNRGPGDDRH